MLHSCRSEPSGDGSAVTLSGGERLTQEDWQRSHSAVHISLTLCVRFSLSSTDLVQASL